MAIGAAVRTRPHFRISRVDGLIWAMRIAVTVAIVWGAWSTLSSGRLDVASWQTLVISGLSQGAVYALLALGYTMVFGTLRFINFAHGDLLMGGAVVGWTVLGPLVAVGAWATDQWLSLVLVFVACVVTSTVLAVVLERVVFRPLKNAPRLTLFIASVGASLVLQYTFLFLFGHRFMFFGPVDVLEGSWSVSGFRVFRTDALVTATAMLAFVALYFLMQRTKTGLAVRAVGEDREAAELMGIDPDRTTTIIFVVGGALAGVAAFIWLLLFPWISFFIGFQPGIKAFTAAVIGGVGNVPGAVLGGYVVGILESILPSLVLGGLGVPAPWQLKDAMTFVLLILVLMFRPTGLLGERLRED